MDQQTDDFETDWDHFIGQRREFYQPQEMQKYKDIEERRKHLEASIVCLIRNQSDKHSAEETFLDIEQCFFDREDQSNLYEFEKGVAEGFFTGFQFVSAEVNSRWDQNRYLINNLRKEVLLWKEQ
jgi:hypothetical protein